MIEWDDLSDWAKRQWLADLGLVIIVLVALALFSILVHRAIAHRSMVLFACLAVTALLALPLFPLLFAILAIPFEIAASVWRTRVMVQARRTD
jgi:hypothetical protein